jgi:hypothetical protein
MKQYYLGNEVKERGAIRSAFNYGAEVSPPSCTNSGLLGSAGPHRNIVLKLLDA